MSAPPHLWGFDRSPRECRFCSTVFHPHPGFADHDDECEYNPMNRPHIWGEAVAVWGER